MPLALYTRMLHSRPILTQSVMTGALMAVGDVAAQQIVEKRGIADHDIMRTMRLSGYGLFFAGPVIAQWYRILDARLRLAHPVRQALARMVIDQAIAAPSLLAAFLAITSFTRRGSIEDVKTSIRENYAPILINNYRVWPIVNFANFYYVPLHHRLLVGNTVSLFWNTYVSYMSNRKVKAAENLP